MIPEARHVNFAQRGARTVKRNYTLRSIQQHELPSLSSPTSCIECSAGRVQIQRKPVLVLGLSWDPHTHISRPTCNRQREPPANIFLLGRVKLPEYIYLLYSPNNNSLVAQYVLNLSRVGASGSGRRIGLGTIGI